MTVMRSNIKIFKIQIGDGCMLENIGNTITRLAMDLLGRNLAGRIPSRSRPVRQNGVTAVA